MPAIKRNNWTAMFNYNVGPQTFEDMQDSVLDQFSRYFLAMHSAGFLLKDTITKDVGLGVVVPPQLALFATGMIAPVLGETIALDVADATHPRLDRIEVEFFEEDGESGTNETGDTIIINKNITASVSISKGTPAASPSVNATTANKLSLGVVLVEANAVTLTDSNLLTDSRYFDTAITSDEVSDITIENNQTDYETGLVFDSPVTKIIYIEYFLYRGSDDSGVTHTGKVNFNYNPYTSTWKRSNEYTGDDCGVEFSVSVGGYLAYTSTDITGLNYVGEMKVLNLKTVARS